MSEEPAPRGRRGDEPGRRRPARCDVCGDVVESRHPWDVQTCSCGRLTLSGGPKHRRVHWRAEPGAGWTDLDESSAGDDGADEDSEASSASASGGASWLRPRGGDGGFDVTAVDGLPGQQQLDDAVERGAVLGQELCRPLLGLAE